MVRFYPLVLLFTVLLNVPALADVNVPGDFDTIQGAIDAIELNPTLGDTVLVARGTYQESISLISDITLQGEETARTILTSDLLQPTVEVNAVTNVTIRNFTLESAETGIQVSNSISVNISSNVFKLSRTSVAVDVTDLSPVQVINNTFDDNGTAVARGSNFVEVVNNIFSSNLTTISPSDISGNISFNCYIDNTINAPLGTNFVVDNDALYVNSGGGDFHLRQGSPCIDEGTGTDIIDGSVADMGAYGGDDADVLPFPVQSITATNDSVTTGTPSVRVDWLANLSYLVSNSSKPGGYQLYYDSDAPGSPYNGVDAGGNTQPSPINVGNVTTFTLANLTPASTPPAAPLITSTVPSNQTIDVRWTAVTGASSYTLYYGINTVTEKRIDVGNVTSFSLGGLQNNVTYLLAVSATAQATYYVNVRAFDNTGEASHISDFGSEASVDLGNALEGALSPTVSAIPEQVQAFPKLSGDSDCFIATAANGSENAWQVRVLRVFRDRYLMSSTFGSWLVSQYYRHSPPMAAYLNRHPQWKPLVRALLAPLAGLTLFLEHTGWIERVATLVVLLMLLVFGLRRFRPSGQETR